MGNQYVVETCGNGTDWQVRPATAAEVADPETQSLPLPVARELATLASAEIGGRWFDHSGDLGP